MDFNTLPDYLAQAEKCMEWANRATDAETELHWLNMAQAYLSLASAVEKDEHDPLWGDASLLGFDHPISPTRH
jgi:hypothetical protein